MPNGKRKSGPARDFNDRKTPVVGGIERDGRVKARVTQHLTHAVLTDHLFDMVDTAANLQTDQMTAYKNVGHQFASHERVRHNVGVYVRHTKDGTQVTTNRIEGFWAGVKRQLHGTHHAVSRKHLHRYLSEAEFKYNNRKLTDGERTVKLIRSTVSRRLTYKQQTSKNRDAFGRMTDR